MFSLDEDAAVHVIDVIVRIVLIALWIAFMAGVLVGLAVIACAVIRDSFVRDGEFDTSSAMGPHGRKARDFLVRWLRPMFFIWLAAVGTAMLWLLIHALFARPT